MAMQPPNPSSSAHKQKAYRLRKLVERGEPISTDDAEWFASYEDAIKRKAEGAVGGSRAHKFSMTEETTEAVGMGDAASIAASSALAREEGRRLDYLVERSIQAMSMACDMYSKMATSAMGIMERMQSRAEKQEDVHLAMLDSVREHYLARIAAEADLTIAEAEKEKQEPKPDFAEDLMKGIAQGMAARAGVKLPPDAAE